MFVVVVVVVAVAVAAAAAAAAAVVVVLVVEHLATDHGSRPPAAQSRSELSLATRSGPRTMEATRGNGYAPVRGTPAMMMMMRGEGSGNGKGGEARRCHKRRGEKKLGQRWVRRREGWKRGEDGENS